MHKWNKECIILLLLLLLLRSVPLLTFLSVSLPYLRQSQSKLYNHQYTLPRALLSLSIRIYFMPVLLLHILFPAADSNVSAHCQKRRILIHRKNCHSGCLNFYKNMYMLFGHKNTDILKGHM